VRLVRPQDEALGAVADGHAARDRARELALHAAARLIDVEAADIEPADVDPIGDLIVARPVDHQHHDDEHGRERRKRRAGDQHCSTHHGLLWTIARRAFYPDGRALIAPKSPRQHADTQPQRARHALEIFRSRGRNGVLGGSRQRGRPRPEDT